jgi:FkbH-like protein
MTTPKKNIDLRGEIDARIATGHAEEAARALRELWESQPGPATAAFVCSRYEKLRGRVLLLQHHLTVKIGDFNAYAQEIIDENSSVYAFDPDSAILAVRTADIAPDLWQGCTGLSLDAIESACERVRSSFEEWIRILRQRSRAALVVHNLEQPIRPAAGVLDVQTEIGQSEAIRNINRNLQRLVSRQTGVYVLDYDALVARRGREHSFDRRKYLTARLPLSADSLMILQREWLRFLLPLTGKTAKALVVDLDNTLWGGVIGEDGIAGIRLGSEYPGAAYQELQRAMMDLERRGILLAICSKNNPEDALEALEKHSGMLLRPKDFSAMRISWNDKVQGLREIAQELNVGIDSLALLDDNPFEREQVRASLPEVMVINLPEDAQQYADTVRDCPVFERLALSVEDQQRTTMYAEQRERSQAQQRFQSKEDFYRFLEQEAEIAPVAPITLARVAQLTQKTNQFNLTTRRYAEQQISEMSASPEYRVLSIRVRDRFGDHGLVGVAITRDHAETCEIDTFLLSCRVIGRTVETALLSYLAEEAAFRGLQRLSGSFIPSKKNAPARDFYAQHGFRLASQGDGRSEWTLELRDRSIPCPDWIKLTISNGAHN